MGVPIIIGVTGHRDLRAEDLARLREVVRAELTKLQSQYPHSEFTVLSPLAAGADTLCAEEALALGMRLVCPLPFDVDDYRTDFTDSELLAFEAILKRADKVFVAPAVEPPLPGRNYRYRQAGIYVATHCHVLLALWNGVSADSKGCGTADTVGFMLEGGFVGASPFDAVGDGAVIHITCPRQSYKEDLPIAAKLIEEREGALNETLERTDSFNADCKTLSEDARDLHDVAAVYDQADRLSMKFQSRYLKTLWALSLFCVLLVVAFLLYDEAEMNIMLIAWGVIIIAYSVFYRLVVRGKYHQKYIHYRMLAESMRVQEYLLSVGIAANVGDDFTWTQRHDITWVRKAIDALLVGGPESNAATPDEVREDWIEGQRSYHEKASKRDGGKLVASDRVTQAMLVCTVLVFVVITVLEFGFPDLMSSIVGGLELTAWGKIVWGCLSAVVLFVAGYYGRLSFERKAFDHEKMAMLFAAAGKRYDAAPEAYESVFRDLAREEIIENGNWMSYCKEDRPTFSL